MEFIQESGYSIRLGKEEEFQRWLEANEDRLAKAYPKGCEYIGTFVVVSTSEKTAGGWRTLERLDSYGAQDRLAAAAKDTKSTFHKLWREAAAFFDPAREAHWSQTLVKRATDASIWDIPSED